MGEAANVAEASGAATEDVAAGAMDAPAVSAVNPAPAEAVTDADASLAFRRLIAFSETGAVDASGVEAIGEAAAVAATSAVSATDVTQDAAGGAVAAVTTATLVASAAVTPDVASAVGTVTAGGEAACGGGAKEAAAENVAAPVFSLAPPPDDSSDDGLDEDGLPTMAGGFGYWSQMLNVTKVDDPLPPPPPKAPAAPRPTRPRGPNASGDQRSWKGGGKGSWGGKGGYRPRAAPLNTNSVGDFFEWAKDPTASDGRERSRSPRRDQGQIGLDSFMSWAQEENEIAPKEEPEDDSGVGLGSFLAWAAEGGRGDDDTTAKHERAQAVKAEDSKDRGEDALDEKEERRLADDEASDDEGAASCKRPRTQGLEAPKMEPTGLPPPKDEAVEATKEEETIALGETKAEKEESDDDVDLAAMQRWRRLDDIDDDV